MLIGITVMNMFLYLFTYLFYKGINKRRDRIWNAWSAKVRSSRRVPDLVLTVA